ncbi:hypothetical protein HYP85_gp074 [Pseudomonas phage Zuri]|uniref:Uncharacterized protein n=1 Tax=Pseudomonas phage Zuri TaxID=2604899 RepID=A0A5C1K5J5_9CAUD|nr:hypothetical protein HYP85_gp074 [Pseudomonas phage Zuri]QEM41093.1 hypothetical protein Zuri_99 [Pseudomonas phage Zuri]
MQIYVKGVDESWTHSRWVPITLEYYFKEFPMDLCAVATQNEIDMINGAALIFGSTTKPQLIHINPLTYHAAICRVDMPQYFLKVEV